MLRKTLLFVWLYFNPRPADSIGHSVRPSLRRPSLRLKCRKNSNSNFLALELDGDLGFSHGHQGSQGHRPHDDDDDEEDDNEVEDNDKDDNNNKDDNNDKGISALGQDRDLGFSQGLQGHRPHDDDDDEEENNEVEDNDKDDNNDKGSQL